jgi:PEP-CTERM motif
MRLQQASALAFATALGLCASSASALVVNVSSLSDVGTTVDLGVGTYTVTFVGVADGAAYDAWNPFGAVTGCDGSGANCAQGYRNAFLITAPSLVGGGSYYSTVDNNYSSALRSLSAYQDAEAAGELVTALASSDLMDSASYSTLVGPITITLAAPTAVKFSVFDTFFGENVGGVSLDLSSTVPEPATWAMMILGFIGLGWAGSRRCATQRA